MAKRNFLTLIVAILSVVSFSVGAFAQDKAPASAPVPAKAKKALPPRDAKGRFIKKGAAPVAAPSKMAPAPAKAKKAMPPRDAKGRFMKKGAAPAAAPAKP